MQNRSCYAVVDVSHSHINVPDFRLMLRSDSSSSVVPPWSTPANDTTFQFDGTPLERKADRATTLMWRRPDRNGRSRQRLDQVQPIRLARSKHLESKCGARRSAARTARSQAGRRLDRLKHRQGAVRAVGVGSPKPSCATAPNQHTDAVADQRVNRADNRAEDDGLTPHPGCQILLDLTMPSLQINPIRRFLIFLIFGKHIGR